MKDGKVVWITGASSGIGEALAKVSAAAGLRVILSSRNAAELERVAAECGAGCAAKVLPMDLSHPESIQETAEKAASIFGPIDILVNNAGVGQRALALDTKPETLRAIFEVNFFASVSLSNAILPSMIKRKSGTIVAISSVLGGLPLPKRSAYVASKHAIEGYFQTLRLELSATGVKVLIVRPGLIATNFSKNAFEADGSTHGKSSAGKWRRTSPETCASAILDAILEGRENLLVGGIETWGLLAKRLLPEQLFNSLYKMPGL